ncbi:MAG: class I SAM-dependent methyltransferase [Candidatus Acidiferrales bacterium]
MEPEYARQYRDLYTRHWWWRAREEAILEVLRRRVPRNKRLRILDVGCGDGLFFDRLAEFGDVDGVEPDEALVDPHGPHRTRIRIAPFDANFGSPESFDLILMLDVLEHLDDPPEALRRAHSLLAPNGALLLTVPAFQLLWTNHDVINHHRLRYRRATLRPLLNQASFSILEERYWYQWTCPAKLAIRLVESVFRRPPAVARVPPAWINRPLYWISRTEQRTLGAIGTPFGSSLMVYCAKNLIARTPGASTPHREFLPRLTRNTFRVPPPVSRSTE